MESKATFKNIKISPKKLRMLLPEIKRVSPEQALDYLYNTPKKGAKLLYKAIKSAISNAKTTLKVDGRLLKFKVLSVDQGQSLKRFRPGGRGTAKPIKRRFSHITVVLIAEEPVQKTSPETAKIPATESTVVSTRSKKVSPMEKKLVKNVKSK